MPEYKIKAKDTQGNLIVDTIEAENKREVVDTLHRRGLTVLGIEQVSARRRTKRYRKRVRFTELALFSRQLSTMVNAGLPLIEGLRVLREQMEHYGFKVVITDVVNEIEGGIPFTDALARHPKTFGPFIINMVRAGEASGSLAEVLVRVADYLESIDSLRRKVRMAMVYPAIVSVMAFLITLVLLLKVIPVFENIYADFGAELPFPTRVLIAISVVFRSYLWVVIIIVVVAIFLLQKFRKTPPGRALLDRFQIRMPIFGPLFHKAAISKFSKTFGTLLKSGVPILSSLDIVKNVSGNVAIERAIGDAIDRIQEGKSIEEPLRKCGVFPPMVVKMVAVGEKSGRLEEMLDKISAYYDEQVSTALAGLANLIEPLLIAFLGIVVGGIVICMFLPIFRLSSIVGV